MKEVSYSELSKRRKQSLETIESALYDLGFTMSVKAGFSNHKDVWKDDKGRIFIHKDMLNCKKQELATDVILHVVKIASHDGETMSSFDENYSLSRNFYRNAMGQHFGAEVDLATVQQRILNNQY
jgi:signal recognition particle subunit SEC65